MDDGRELMEPFLLHYSDLLLLSSSSSSPPPPPPPPPTPTTHGSPPHDLSNSILHALGPSGPGLLSVAGVPRAAALRRRLLPLARRLALLPRHLRNPVLKENGLGSDVPLKNPDRSVSSFALQLKYDPEFSVDSKYNEDEAGADGFQVPIEHEFENLGSVFRALGAEMMDIGIRIARICDRAVGGHELENSILESSTAKGRLIHYHSDLDGCILKECSRVQTGRKKRNSDCHSSYVDEIISKENVIEFDESRLMCKTSISDLWQQWHYDYGIFTVLTAPMFMLSREAGNGSCVHETSLLAYPGHSFLQIFDPRKNKILLVRTCPENLIVQVGESADILSKGKLRSTLHSVCKPKEHECLSRESFVVFLQPAWDKKFYVSDYRKLNEEAPVVNGDNPYIYSNKQCSTFDSTSQKLSEEIHEKIPPLMSRLRDGMTFAEFSRETTKQYYGGKGVQSMR